MSVTMTSGAVGRPPSSLRRAIVEWVLVVATLAVATVLFYQRGRPLRSGADTEATFFFIAPDLRNAECAADLDLEDYRCRYHFDGRKHRDRSKRQVVPLNGDRGLMLLVGIFKAEEVRKRVKQEPPGRPLHTYDPIRAHCRLRLLHNVRRVKARWERGAWITSERVWLALVQDCEILE